MRFRAKRGCALSGATVLCVAFAAWPTGAQQVSFHGDLSLVSDYRYRGISQSGGAPAAQADLSIATLSGFYSDLFASTIAPLGAARQELDVSVGRRWLVDGVTLDTSVVAYTYPAARAHSYVEVPIALSKTAGPWTWTAGGAYAPAQPGTHNRSNTYGYVSLDRRVSHSPISIDAMLGREDGAFARRKLDWSLGTTVHLSSTVLSLSYVGYGEVAARGSALVATAGFRF
jgi:uncharacterized protein (TIGR02001 family)